MRVHFPVLLVASGCAMSGCVASADVQDSSGGSSDVEIPNALSTTCRKQVFVHLANWTYADPLNDPRSPDSPNGCWGFNMARRWGRYWGDCKGASNKGHFFPDTWVDNWGSPANWASDGPKLWTYNETSFAHDPTDAARIDNCWTHFTEHWNTTPDLGYAYMIYQGSSGWHLPGSNRISRSFAELYGQGTWWPYWSQWKANPVGRPMAQIANVNDGGNAYTVTKGLCDYVASGSFIGLWIEGSAGGLTYDSSAHRFIVKALNDCTLAP